jgi:pyruvate-formate lyase-activating enzyme
VVEDIHDFSAKLRQPGVADMVRDYIRWQASVRAGGAAAVPDFAPVSINLDLTTACNYRCDHCIDWDILNSGVRHADADLRASLREMARRGLRSVILIGGGEPTLYPGFGPFVRFLKEELRLQVAVVSNGGKNQAIFDVCDAFDGRDWVRLSLDSASDPVFQAMHRPRRAVTLDEICAWIPRIKEKNPRLRVGFSFVITWKGAMRDDARVVENIHEIVPGAERARRYRFDYIAYKPFLVRSEINRSEVMDPARAEDPTDAVIARIRAAIEEAKRLQTPGFRVIESTNLRVLEEKTWKDYQNQPRHCHMQYFRQVVTPHGVFNCPVYRSNPIARIGGATAWKDPAAAQASTARFVADFDAHRECREVTCLYNPVNWWLEDLVTRPERLEDLSGADLDDFFL